MVSENNTANIKIFLDKEKNPVDLKLFGSLNDTDWGIVFYLGFKERSVGELTRLLKIAPVNTWKHIAKLKELDILEAPEVKKGKKKIVRLKSKNMFETAKMLYGLKKKIKNYKVIRSDIDFMDLGKL